MATCRKAGLRLAEAMEKLTVAASAADAGRRDTPPREDRGGRDAMCPHRRREHVTMDPPGGDAEFDWGVPYGAGCTNGTHGG